MKRRFTILTAALVLLAFLTIPMGMRGQTTSTYTFTSKSWTATLNGSAANWTSGQDGAGFSNNGIQVTTSASGANGTSPASFTNVTKIVCTYNTNKSKGAGSIVAKIGNNTETSNSVGYSGSANGTTANFTTEFNYATPQSGNVKLTVNCTTNSIYLVSVAITTGGSTPATHTLTFSANPSAGGTVSVNNGNITSPASIAEGASVNISATPNTGYVFSNWTVSGTGATLANANSSTTTFTMGTANATLTANFTALNQWTVTYHANGGTGNDVVDTYYEGEDVTVAANTFTYTGYAFTEWNTADDGNGTAYAPGDEIQNIDDNIHLYAQWEVRNETEDCLDRAFTGVTSGSTTYKDWRGEGDSGVAYSGNSAGSNNSIQLRSSNNSGIVSTTSGGKVMKVEVEWQSNTAADRVLQVYGSNDAYTAPSNLYSNSTQGTLLGTIVKGTSTSLNITGDYAYVGLRSASGAMYLSSICITWGSASALAAPAIEPTTLTFVDSQEITITAPEGASVRYTLDGTEPTATTGLVYDGPFFITNTTTVKAIAYNETSSSQVTTVTYTRVYNITLVQPTGGVISVSSLQAAENATVTLTATPNVGYSFSSWSVNDGAISVNNNTFTMPASDVTVSASFVASAAGTYTVSFSINNKIEMTATVDAGNSIDMTKFVADVTTEGYIFSGWYTAATDGTKLPDSYQPSADITVYAQFGEPAADAYTLVTNVEQLEAGNKVVIAADGTKNCGMSTTQESNNRGTATLTKNNNIITFEEEAGLCELTLGSSNGHWTFYDGDGVGGSNGYLYAASSSSNHLKTQATNDANGEWMIVVASNGDATITAQGSYTRNILRYNSGSNIFSCYSTGQQPVWLYTKPASSKGTRVNVTAKSMVTGIAANVMVTVKDGGIVYLTGDNNGNESNLVVEEGGQLVSTNHVEGTMLKSVNGYGNNTRGDYYFISSPFTGDETSPMAVRYMINTAGYDLFYFDQSNKPEGSSIYLEWVNYKDEVGSAHPGFNLIPGKGYLYANKESKMLEFAGTLRRGLYNGDMNSFTKSDLDYDNSVVFAGWNLVGNPFTSNATVDRAFYKINNTTGGVNTTPVGAGGMIAPLEGVFVLAEEANESVTFDVSPTTPNKSRAVNVDVAREGEFLDRAIVTMGEGSLLKKLYLSENTTTISIPQDGNDYAIVPSNGQNEMPVSFKAARDAQYTISIDAENVEMSYLHLIDNMTGKDIDLLQTPSYSFEAKTTDYTSRFKLVFATGDNSNSDTFAFFSNGSFVINNEGNATLQVIDVTGRIIKSESINGSANVNINAAPGVYMLRLVNGDNVKVQKVVVK